MLDVPLWCDVCSERSVRAVAHPPAIGLHNLLFDDYVPGCCRWKVSMAQKQQNPLWAEILHVTPETTTIFFERVVRDFERTVSKKASTKAKQQAVRDSKALAEIADFASMFSWLMHEDTPRLKKLLTSDQVAKYSKLFYNGPPGP